MAGKPKSSPRSRKPARRRQGKTAPTATERRPRGEKEGPTTLIPTPRPEVEDLAKLPELKRDELRAIARRLGIRCYSRLRKAELLALLQETFREKQVEAEEMPLERETLGARLAPGAHPKPVEPSPHPVEARLPQHIPWGYGRDRVTAMAVDPENLYAYGELTDEGIGQARSELGIEGGVLLLRVHDVTGRIFDGTNSHHHVDLEIERSDREWFLLIGRPTSTVVVEMGIRAPDGRFNKVARSRRVTFPRREPGLGSPVEWLTVERAPDGRPQPVGPAPAWDQPGPGPWTGGGEPETGPQAALATPAPIGVMTAEGGPVYESIEGTEWVERIETGTTVERSEPFSWTRVIPYGGGEGEEYRWSEETYAVDGEGSRRWTTGPEFWRSVEPIVIHRFFDEGEVVWFGEEEGHKVIDRWEVEMSNLGAWAERRVLARWHLSRTVTVEEGESVVTIGDPRAEATSRIGASAARWRRASEIRLGGGSEVFRRGASERRFGGASELQWRRGSQLRIGGASEIRRRGASQYRIGGASEFVWRGASEYRLGGASEMVRWGASERQLYGASELWQGASEHRFGGASERHQREQEG